MSVRVVARIRPLLEKELDKDVIVTADRTEEGASLTLVKIPNPKNETEEFSFAFNSVYDQGTPRRSSSQRKACSTCCPRLRPRATY